MKFGQIIGIWNYRDIILVSIKASTEKKPIKLLFHHPCSRYEI